MPDFNELFAQLAALAGYYQPTIQLLTVIASAGIAAVILVLRREVLPEEKWAQFFGWAFAVFFIQYLPRLGEVWLREFDLLTEAPWPVYIKFFKDTVVLLGSLANNLLLLAAARALLGYQKLFDLFPPWALILGPLAIVSEFYGLLDDWQRFPDALFSAVCLFILGWAMYLNFTTGRRRILATLNIVGGGLYGLANVAYAFNPVLARSDLLLTRTLNLEIARLAELHQGAAALNVLACLDAFLYGVAFLLKLLLFVGALLLMMKSLTVLSPREARGALEAIKFGRDEYLTNRGILQALGESVGADLAVLCFRLPGFRQTAAGEELKSEVAWWRWHRSSDAGSTRPEVTPVPPADRSIVGRVFSTGEEISSVDRLRDPRVESIYWEKVPGMRAFVTVPLRYQGAVIGCLNLEWKSPRSFTATSIQRIRHLADFLAPMVHARRQLNALEVLRRRLREMEGEETRPIEESLGEIAVGVHQILAPRRTGLFFNFGFRCRALHVSGERNVKWLRQPCAAKKLVDVMEKATVPAFSTVRFETFRSRLGSVKRHLGTLFLTGEAGHDPLTRPALMTDYLHRQMISSLVAESLLELVRIRLDSLLNDLRRKLNQAEILTAESWFEALKAAVGDSSLLWVVARLPDGQFFGLREDIDEVSSSWRWKAVQFSDFASVTLLVPPDSEQTRILRLGLRSSGAELWLGVERRGFKGELEFASPWKVFLQRLVETADSALVRAERQRLQAEAQQLTEVAIRTEMAGLIMHEMRNHASEFSLGVRTVKDAVLLANKTKALHRVTRLGQISTEFSELASLLGGTNRADKRRRIPLLEPLEKVQRLQESRLMRANIEFTVEVDDALEVEIPFDVVLLALSNLISNAAKAIARSRPAGVIVVTAEKAAPWVRCHVVDDGPGVPPDIQDVMFELHKPENNNEIGWGLALSRSALRRHRGNLTHSLTAEGQTRFTVWMPRAH